MAALSLDDFDKPEDAFYWAGMMTSGLTVEEVMRIASHARVDSGEPAPLDDREAQRVDPEDGGVRHPGSAPAGAAPESVGSVALGRAVDLDLSQTFSFAVFDTETTGFATSDVVVQFCVLLYGPRINFHYESYWCPPSGVRVSKEAMRVHGITPETLAREGRSAKQEVADVRRLFEELLHAGVRIVAHNASFDNRLLRQTAEAFGEAWPFSASDFFCTQVHSRAKVCARDKLGRLKAPTNAELYLHFHDALPDGRLHDAHAACRITASGYVRGRDVGWW